MDPELWQQVSSAFSTAQELDPAGRETFLDGLAQEVRAQVVSLLRANDEAGDLFEPGQDRLEAGMLLDQRFVMEALVARGGMGEVYRAHRRDNPDAHVAIKLLSPMFVTREAARLFNRERHILAQLSHSDIVTFIDSGETAGRPYFVMEWVEGERLDQWAARASRDARLALFERICAAVHSAHQAMIVHCDLKPSNILVTASAEPKLLDFGIARMLTSSGELPAATRTSLRVLTLNYASPEQARDLPAGIPSDVYSLGLILYELLTGRMAQNVESLPLDQAITAITDREPDYRVGLPSDLVAILRKATAKEINRRYASVSEFAADVARFRSGYPVVARNPTFGYQASLFFKRNRVPVIAAAAGLMAATVGLVAFALQFQQTQQQKLLAEKRFRAAREMAQLMIFDGPARLVNVPGTLETRKWMAERASGYLQSLSADIEGDESMALAVARSYRQVAYQQFNFNQAHLNDPSGALSNLERGGEVLQALRRQSAATIAEQIVNRLERPYAILNRSGDAIANGDVAEKLAKQLAGLDPSKSRVLLARVWFSQASVSTRPVAERLHLWGLLEQYFEAELAKAPQDQDRLRNLSLVRKNTAGALLNVKDWRRAAEQAGKALAIDEKRLTLQPANGDILMDISFDLGLLGQALGYGGKPEQAIPHIRRAVELRDQVAQRDPADMRARDRKAWMMAELARWLFAAKQSGEAMALTEAALQIRNRIQSPGMGNNSIVDLHSMRAAEFESRRNSSAACAEWKSAFLALPADTSSRAFEDLPLDKIRQRSGACRN